MKKLLKILAVVFGLLIAAVIIVPFVFKDDLLKLVNDEANKTLKGELIISDLNVSLIKNFPDLSLTLQELSYTGSAPFEGEKLFDISEVVFELDIMKALLANGFEVKSIEINEPTVSVKVLKGGAANYDIIKEVEPEEPDKMEDTKEDGEEPFSFQLSSFKINGLNLTYDDLSGQTNFSIAQMDYYLSGNFTDEITDINSESHFEQMNLFFGGVQYLKEVQGSSDFDVVYNSKEESIKLGENYIELNRVRLAFEGVIGMLENGYDLDLKYTNKQTDFKALMTLIPAVYKTDFDEIKSSGMFNISGNINGRYLNDSENYPSFETELEVENGAFSYEGYSESLKDVFVKTHVNHPGGELDAMKIDLEKFTANLAGNSFIAQLKVTHPLSDPNVAGMAKGKINLGSINEIMPLDDELTGIIKVDANFKGKVSDFEKGDMNQAQASGNIAISRLKWISQEYNIPLSIDTLYGELAPNRVNLPVFNSKVGVSDFAVNGALYNAFAYVFNSDEIKGVVNVKSSKIDLNEFAKWASTDGSDSSLSVETNQEAELEEMEVVRIPKNISLKANIKVDELLYEENKFTDVNGAIKVDNGVAELSNLDLGLKSGRIYLNGKYDSKPKRPRSNLSFKIRELPFQEALTSLDIVKKYLPFAKDVIGDLNTTLNVSTRLNGDMTPDYNTLSANGKIKTAGLSYSSKILKEANTFFVNEDISKVNFTNADLSFEVKNGTATIKPVKVELGSQEFILRGSHSIEQNINYSLKGKIPVKGIELPKELAMLGIDASQIDLELKVGGTMSNPSISPVFGNIEMNSIAEEIKDSVVTVVKKNVKEEADKILAQAQAQADAILAEAKKQVAALKKETDKQTAQLKKEAEKLVADLKKEAEGDLLKQMAADIAAETALKEANKEIDALNNTSKQEADKILVKAKKQADEIMKQAQIKAQKLSE